MWFRLLITRFLRYKVVIWLNLLMELLIFFTQTFQKKLTRVKGRGTVSHLIKTKRPSAFLCLRSSLDHLQTVHDNLLCNRWFGKLIRITKLKCIDFCAYLSPAFFLKKENYVNCILSIWPMSIKICSQTYKLKNKKLHRYIVNHCRISVTLNLISLRVLFLLVLKQLFRQLKNNKAKTSSL